MELLVIVFKFHTHSSVSGRLLEDSSGAGRSWKGRNVVVSSFDTPGERAWNGRMVVVDSFDTPGERAWKGRLVAVDPSCGTPGERENHLHSFL